ncbi:MAG: hypothetical protein ACKOE4_08230, partial [Candidatus Kapaibacterium sp.]
MTERRVFQSCAVAAALLLSVVSALSAPYFEGRIRLTVRDSVRAKDIPVTITYACDSSSGDNRPLVGTGSGTIPTFGVAVVGHGYQMPVTAYKTLATTICQNAANFVVVLPETGSGLFPNHNDFAQDMAAVAAYMQREGKRKGSIWEGHIRDETILAGHSMGGGATFIAAKAMLQAGTPRLSGVIAFAPAETNPSSSAAAASVTCPTLIIAGGVDCVTPLGSTVQPIYDKLSAPCKVLAVIPGASHCQFADANSTCNLGELNCKATVTRDAQFARCWQYVNRFLAKSDDVARVIDNTQVQTTMVFPSAADVALGKSDGCVGDTVSVRYTGTAKDVLWLPDSIRSAVLSTKIGRDGTPLSLVITTCFSTTRIDTIVRTVPMPTAQIVGDSLMCPGDSVRLSVRTNASSTNPVSVRWSTGETTESIAVRQPGTVVVTATSGRGCGSATTTKSIATVDVPRFTLQLTGDTILCDSKGAIQLSLQGETDRIERVRWSTGDTSRSISLREPGRYVLSAAIVVRGERVCAGSTDTIAVNLQLVTPPVPVIRYERDTLWSTPADSYQWMFQGAPLANARTMFHVPTKSGSYAVITTRDDEGACKAQSASYPVTLTSVHEEQRMPQLAVAAGLLRIAASAGTHVVHLRDLRGETVLLRN